MLEKCGDWTGGEDDGAVPPLGGLAYLKPLRPNLSGGSPTRLTGNAALF